MSSEKIPTIDEYLAMQDWVFDPRIKQGEHGDFYWMHYIGSDLSDPFKRIESPHVPFCVLIKPDIYSSLGLTSIVQSLGWKQLGSFAVSSWSDKMPIIDQGNLGTLFVVDRLKSESEILKALADFEDLLFHQPKDLSKFLQVVDQLQPYCAVSGYLFLARGKHVYQQYFNEELLDEIRRLEWRSALDQRQRFWKNQGPECGPETCVEPDCTRLRIKLAVRCFVHHAMGLWVPGHGLD